MNEKRDRLEEQHRVNEVIEVINYKEKKLLSKASNLRDSVIQLRKTFFDDVTVNLDEPDEVIETYASIKQQAELLSERERSHGIADQQLRVLQRLKDSPYFGRIDFREDGEKLTEQIYIGIASLMDREDEDFLIYDWRAPISSLYYDYPPGEAEFATSHGKITGEILLKRQFIINRGKIKGMFNTGLTIGDDLLQQALGSHSSEKMRNIVATIQKEQNRIIRNEGHKYLIVQGVAGSGKTSAALQRVAYLMYRYRDLIHEDQIILFSPNPLFNSYVSNVLPELGEENMRQTTFLEYIIRKVDEDLVVETPFEQMEYMLTATKNKNYQVKMNKIAYQSSLQFKEVLDAYMKSLEKEGIIFENIYFQDEVLISNETISDYFYGIDRTTSIANSLTIIAEWLLKEVEKYKQKEFAEDWVLEEVELLDDEDLLEAYTYVQDLEDESEFYDSGMEEEFLRGKVIDRSFLALENHIKQFGFINIFSTYRNIFVTYTPPHPHEHWDEIKKQAIVELDQRFLSWENATPYIYFKENLLGENTDRSVKYLFIDEAQDYTEFQLAYLKHVFPHTRMTFLGDVNQAILMHTNKSNPLIVDYESSYERIELLKSYRSTKEIIEFTRHFLPSDVKIEPFERKGNKPKVINYLNEIDFDKSLLEEIDRLFQMENETIAIVCKTFAESKKIAKRLQNKIPFTLMTETSRELRKGVLILPVYLAKGIEFDAVIIPDVSSDSYISEYDQYLLYTACTRAMHDLVLLSKRDLSRFILNVPGDKFEVENMK